MAQLVTSVKECLSNIDRFQSELKSNRGLQERLPYARAWYAYRGENGKWLFGPSKFIGYKGLSGDEYTRISNNIDGRRTEAQISQWFVALHPGDALFDELASELSQFLAKYRKAPSAKMRINVIAEREPGTSNPQERLLDLILAVVETMEPRYRQLLRNRLPSK
jgi:hypothetical protein